MPDEEEKSEDRQENMEDTESSGPGPAPRGGDLPCQRNTRILGKDRCDLLSAGRQARSILVLPESRNHHLIEDTPRPGIGKNRLQSVSRFDSNLSIIDGCQNKNSIVFSPLSDAPLLKETVRKIGDLTPFKRAKSDDRNLGTGFLFQFQKQA